MDDRYFAAIGGRSRLARGLNHGRGRRENYVDLYLHQFGGEPGKLVNVVRPAKFNHNVLALDPAEVAQADPQGVDTPRPSGRGSKTEVSDASNLYRLLRAYRGDHAAAVTQLRHRPPVDQRPVSELTPPSEIG
jgi:hypothetical protein